MNFVIEFYINGEWMSLPGHNCMSIEAAKAYCNAFDPEGKELRVREIN